MMAILSADTLLMTSTGSSYPKHTQNPTFPCRHQRPIFRIPLRKVATNIRASINSLDVIEKEFEFKPSFDDYLKAMETVQETKKQKAAEPASTTTANNSYYNHNNTNSVNMKNVKKKKREEEGKGGNSKEVKEVIVKSPKRRVGLEKVKKNGGQNGEFGFFDEERKAFRSLVETDDICDKPRVSRVDMEERIEKLAKCLNGADIDMPEWMFSKTMRSAKIRFSDHSILRIIQILGKLGNWRRVLQVIEWIQTRERFKSHKTRYIYTAALDALGKAKRPVEALNLFRAMQQQFSLYPDLVAYHCIAVTLGQAGYLKELFDVMDSMRSLPKKNFKTGVLDKWDPRLEADNVVYNAVLNACVRRKNWEGAFWVLQQLKLKGQQPSGTTYGLVMEVMFACGKYNLVHDFFKKIQKSCIPNALTYKVLVNTFWKEGKTDEAIAIVEDMERRGIVGTAALYYDLARCLCSAGRSREALMQIEKICRVANKPLVVTYTGLMQACLDSGNVQSGAYIFNHMQKFCSPNLVTYNIMLKAYIDNDLFEEAKQLFTRLLERSHSIRSKSDCNDRVMPDIYTFNTMLDACIKEQNWDDFEIIYVQMLNHGYHFNPKRHLGMIMDACCSGKVGLLEITWNHLVHADRLPPPLLIREMFRIKLEQGSCSAALSCLIYNPSLESPVFSTKSWSKFFMDNAHRFEKDILLTLLHEASTIAGDYKNRAVQNLVTSCTEFLRNQTSAQFRQTVSLSRSTNETALVF